MPRLLLAVLLAIGGTPLMAQQRDRRESINMPGPGHEELEKTAHVRPTRVRSWEGHYPEIAEDAVTDDFHGTIVRDPFRWLEDLESARTRAFIEGQAELYGTYLSDTAGAREWFSKRLHELLDFPRIESYWREGEWNYVSFNSGLESHASLYRQKTHRGQRELVFDPRTLSADGTTTVASYHPTKDGALIALQLTDGGLDWRTIRILDTASGEFLPDTLKNIRFSNINWKSDGSGFYYTRVPQERILESAPEQECSIICFHKVGTEQEQDEVIYSGEDDPSWSWGVSLTDDDRYLIYHTWKTGADHSRMFWAEAANPSERHPLFDAEKSRLSIIDNDGTTFFAVHRHETEVPNARIVRFDLGNPGMESWEEVLPEQQFPLESVVLLGDTFIIESVQEVTNRLYRLPIGGGTLEQIPTPPAIAINPLKASRKDTELVFTYASFLEAMVVASANPQTGAVQMLHPSAAPVKPSDYVVRQEYFNSPDGTRVPMYIMHRADVKVGEPRPTILYGYGGFNASQMPSFSTYRIAWLDAGGVFVLANIRGGGEFGSRWHAAAKLEKRQNAYDDFIRAGEMLIKMGITSREQLAIEGRSNGGLLVSAVALQRPNLFRAVISVVPVTDMLRYHKLTIGRYWMSEFGDPENPDHFPFLYAYSPLHNVKRGVALPAILVSSAELDDRVHPAHSLKFIAALQKYAPVGGIKLLRFESRAGHGTGKPVDKLLQERAEQLSFLARELGMKVSGN